MGRLETAEGRVRQQREENERGKRTGGRGSEGEG